MFEDSPVASPRLVGVGFVFTLDHLSTEATQADEARQADKRTGADVIIYESPVFCHFRCLRNGRFVGDDASTTKPERTPNAKLPTHGAGIYTHTGRRNRNQNLFA